MTHTHTKKPVNVRAFIFNGHIDCLDQNQVDAKLFQLKDYDSSNTICEKCDQHFDDHASIEIVQGAFTIVCPGDYVINNPQFPKDFYTCKPDVFNETYDALCEKSTTSGSLGENYCSSNYVSESNMYYRKQHKEQLKLDAAKHLLQYGTSIIAKEYLEKYISEPEVDELSFGEVMALITDNNGILVSRQAYSIDYIYFDSEIDTFMSYNNGKAEIHSFESKDYTANDWYVVN